jgi:hypothetical protein
MRSRNGYLALLILGLLANGCFVSLVSSQGDQTFALLTVTINTPVNATTVTAFNNSFTYIPVINGTNDYFIIAKLYINGTETSATNQTAIANDTSNTIQYSFTANGTYLWNVQVRNSTTVVFASANYTLNVSVYVPAPTPTPSPTSEPTTASTPTTTPTATSTPTPTASPSPTPAHSGLSAWGITIIGVFVLVGILIVIMLILRSRRS